MFSKNLTVQFLNLTIKLTELWHFELHEFLEFCDIQHGKTILTPFFPTQIFF